MKTIISFIFLFAVFGIQNTDTKYPDFMNKDYSQVLENNKWEILVSAEGDLNNDSINDLVLILESSDSIFEKRCESCDSLKNKARIILVLIQEADSQRVICQNNYFIARNNEGGMVSDLTPEIYVENQLLNISYQYTRGNMSYNFKYEEEDLALVEAMSAGVTGEMFESDHFDFIKKTIVSESGSISDEEFKMDTIPMNHFESLRKLSEMDIMYEWEVAEGKFL